MDEQTVNDELDFGASDSTTEQTPETNESPEIINEQSENLDSTDQSTTAANDGQVDASQDDAQVSDEVLERFLVSKGIKLDEPEISKETLYKLGKMTYNSERQFTRGAQELAELKRQLASSQPSQPQSTNTEAGSQVPNFDGGAISDDLIKEVTEWENAKGLSEEDSQKMINWLSTPIGKNEATGQDIIRMSLLANHSLSLEDVYHAAGCGNAKADALKEQMMNEVKKEMAARQSAKRPAAKATNSSQFDETKSDPFAEGLLGE